MNNRSRRIRKEDVEAAHPLLGAQQGMLFHDLASPGDQPYFRQTRVRVEGRFDPALCERAWNELMKRHVVLRSCFEYENAARPVQLIWRERGVEFSYSETACIDDYLASDRRRGFDLRRDPLVRVAVFRLDAKSWEIVWSSPHIILDGWSGSVLISEFAQVYSDLEQDRAPALAPAPPYRDYLNWRASRSSGQPLEFWKKRLAGYDTLASIPKIGCTLQRATFVPGEHAFFLAERQTGGLAAMAARNGATLSTAIQALWGMLLSRYNNTDDVVFGSVVSGRPAEVPGIERMVGLFLNTIPVRVRLEAGVRFGDLLRMAQRDAVEAMAHDFIALSEIQAATGLGRGLFDHILVVENYPQDTGAAETGFRVVSATAIERSNYDFGVLVLPGRAIQLAFKYNAAIYPARRVERIEGHFRALVEQVLAGEAQRVDDLSILTPGERTSAVGPRIPVDPGATIVSLWETNVRRAPARPALALDHREWSYSELNTHANRISHFLRGHSVTPGAQAVGVLMERGEGRIAALLGILKAGCTYVPISTTTPAERLRFLLADSGCRHVLTDRGGCERLDAVAPGRALLLDDCASGAGDDPPRVSNPGEVAYLIYTSGSTGRPKGVEVEHRAFVNMVLDQIRVVGLTPADRVLQFASCSFDASLSEIFMALLSGACLVLAREPVLRDGRRFVDMMEQRRVSVVTLPPSYLRALERPEFPGLRVLITAGEPPDLADARHYASRLRYFNAYGPTETAVCATMCEVPAAAVTDAEIPLGAPVANTTVRLLDRHLRPVPAGVPGEICISGAGLARGYRNHPDLTAAKFAASPFAAEDRLYRTGDSACWTEAGEIVYLGRTDSQIKYRGFRIDLREIESVLREYPGIGQAVAALRGPLIAWVVADPAPDPAALRAFLGERLPAHMVPSAILPVADIPRTVAGKVDRDALPAPESLAGRCAVSAATEAEQALATICAEVLGQSEISVQDSFTALGGDSLKAILVAGRLRRRGWQIHLPDLFDLPDFAAVAAALRKPVSTPSGGIAGAAPLTPVERWFFERHSRAHWHQLSHAVLLRFGDRHDETAVRTAIDAVWRHHDALRSRFHLDAPVAIQEVAPRRTNASFSVLDLRDRPSAWDTLRAHAESLHQAFDLAAGPLFRAILFRMPEADHVLLLSHHLVMDAVSWRILLEDFEFALTGADLPPRTSSYAEWSHALARYARSERLLEQRPYWQAIHREPDPPLPTDFDAVAHHYGETETISIEIRVDLPRSVAEPEVEALLLAALARTIHCWTGRRRGRVWLASHGRIPLAGVDTSRTTGWFTANFPFRWSIADAQPDARGAAFDAIRAELAEVPDLGAGYQVLEYLTPAEWRAGFAPAPTPEIACNYLGRVDVPAGPCFTLSDRLPASSVGPLERHHKLEFDAVLTSSGLEISMRYCPKLHRAATAAHICRLLREEFLATYNCRISGGLELLQT